MSHTSTDTLDLNGIFDAPAAAAVATKTTHRTTGED